MIMTRASQSASRSLFLVLQVGFATALAISLILLPAPAMAQIDSGSIVGDVTDAQGGVLPGATVVAT